MKPTDTALHADETSEVRAILLEMAQPTLFERNPFRLLELPTEASARDLNRRRQAVEQAARNHLLPPPGPSRLLMRVKAPDDHEVRAVGHELANAKRRLVHELFWFWPLELGGAAGDEALRSLAAGDSARAAEMWSGLAGDGIPESHASAAWHNLGVYALFAVLEAPLDSEPEQSIHAGWKKVWAWWVPLATDGTLHWARLRDRIQAIEDPALKSGAAESLRRALLTALGLLQIRHALRLWDAGRREVAAGLLTGLAQVKLPPHSSDAVEEARRIAATPLREALQLQCETLEAESKMDKRNAAKRVEHFLDQVKPSLEKLDALLPKGNTARTNAHDAVALAGLTAQIAYGNETDDWPVCIGLLDKCRALAEGAAAIKRIEENGKIIRGNQEGAALRRTCWYCGEADADAASAQEVAMHGDIQRTLAGYNQYRVTWRHVKITVPRCQECAGVHAKAGYGAGAGCLVFVLALITAFVVGQSNEQAGIAVGISGLIGSIIIAAVMQSHRPKIKGKNRTQADFPLIKQLKAEGWAFGEKPATS